MSSTPPQAAAGSGAALAPSPQPARRQGNRVMLKQSGLIGGIAALGVLAGLGLDISIAGVFGAGAKTDAFFVAARIPLGLIAVVMVAANQALVPAFGTLFLRCGDRATSRLVSIVVTALMVAGGALTLLSWLLATAIVRVTAPGLGAGAVATAATMVPIMFAVVPLVAVGEVLGSALNARYSFAASASTHIVMNGIAAALVIFAHRGIETIAVAYLVGAAAKAIFMVGMCARRGVRLRPSLRITDPEVRGIGRLCVRPLAGASTNPLARLGEQLVLSFLPVGAITIVSYGYRLISAIGGTVFFRSVVVALVPRLTEASARGDDLEVERISGLGLRIMLAVSLPLTAFMAVLAQVGAVIVFQRGSFHNDKAVLLGLTLAVYAGSLVGSAVQRALLAPFFARLDTATPLRNTLYGVGANLVLLPLFILPLGLRNEHGVVGVALAYSLAQYVNVAHAAYCLRRLGLDLWHGIAPLLVKLVVASAMASAAMVATEALLQLDLAASRPQLIGKGTITGLVGVAVLAVATGVLAGGELAGNWRALRGGRRGRRVPAAATAAKGG